MSLSFNPIVLPLWFTILKDLFPELIVTSKVPELFILKLAKLFISLL